MSDHGDEFTSASSTTSSTYSVDKFYVTTRNSKDHSSGIKIAIPPEVAARIQALIARQTIPYYRTAADVHRDALVHRLHFLEEYLKDDAPTTSKQIAELKASLMAEAELDNAQLVRDSHQRVFDKARRYIEQSDESDYEEVCSIVRKSLITISSDRKLHAELTKLLDKLRP